MAETLPDLIRDQARKIGFDSVGITTAEADPCQMSSLTTYLEDGRHGDMAWMAETIERRSSPKGLWPQVRSVIVLGTSYAPADDPRSLLDHPTRGLISVYARNKDYHDTVKKRLKHLARWLVGQTGAEVKVFVDTAPVMEKPLGARAGLGWQGKHSNLVSRRFGSWLFLGEIYTTLDLPPDPPHANHCGACRRCLDICPTGALDSAGHIDPRRCISYLTIEHKGSIPVALRSQLGNRIYGCDDCLSVCPWNKFAPPTREPDFLPRAELTAPRLGDLATLDDADFRQIFTASPIKRIGRDRFIRNVLIAIGNSGQAELATAARPLLTDASPLVRETAAWALGRLLAEESSTEPKNEQILGMAAPCG